MGPLRRGRRDAIGQPASGTAGATGIVAANGSYSSRHSSAVAGAAGIWNSSPHCGEDHRAGEPAACQQSAWFDETMRIRFLLESRDGAAARICVHAITTCDARSGRISQRRPNACRRPNGESSPPCLFHCENWPRRYRKPRRSILPIIAAAISAGRAETNPTWRDASAHSAA